MFPKPKAKLSGIKEKNWLIEELPGLSQDEIDNLKNKGFTSTLSLVKQAKTLQEKLILAQKLQVNVQYVNKWVALADLARIPQCGSRILWIIASCWYCFGDAVDDYSPPSLAQTSFTFASCNSTQKRFMSCC